MKVINMVNNIYIVKKLWLDSLENNPDSAVGYTVIGYVSTEEEAKEFYNKGKTYTKEHCWAVPEKGLPEYNYEEIKYLTI